MPGTLQLISVTKTPQRIQTFMVSNDSFMLVNPDITNNIFIGNDPGSQIIAVPALGSITLDASKHDIWVSTNGGNFTVNAYLMPNGSNWVPSPAQVAAQINALGLAKESTQLTGNTNIAQVNTTLGTPPQKSDVNQVNTTLGVPPQKTDVNQVNTTLGVPAQTVDVNGVSTNVVGLTTNGIPPLRGTNNLGNATGQTIATGVNATLVNVASINKPGFEAVFSVSIPAAAGTVPFCILQVIWTDSATGLTVGQKQYVITSGNGSANALTYYLSGPCRGNQITVKLRNQDPAQTATITWAVNQTSHTYLFDRLLQPLYAATAPITFTNPNGNPSKGLLFSSTPTIANNANTTRLIAAYNGKVKINLDNTVQPGAAALQINTPSATGLYEEAAAPTSTFKMTCAAGAQANGEWFIPNGAMVAQIFNTAAAGAITPNVTMTIAEY